jgi:hypothetical protein
MNHGELQDKFVAEIIRLLDWCDDTYKRMGQGRDTMSFDLQGLPINQIMPVIERELP